MNEALKLIQEAERERLYVTIEVKFEAGRVVLVRKTQTFKPSANLPINGGYHHGSKPR